MKRTGIVVALAAEAACFRDPPPAPGEPIALDDRFLLIVSGMGTERARQAALKLIGAGAQALLNVGFAGALDEQLVAGHVLVPEEIVSSGGRTLTSAAWGDNVRRRMNDGARRIARGAMACSLTPLCTPAEKEQLRRNTGAVGVDMESAAVVLEAARCGVPALVVRIVLDGAETSLPPAILDCSDVYGRTDMARLARRLVVQPSLVPSLATLAIDFRRAARSLRDIGQRRMELLVPA